jgi:ketosteroid isomerase-like protein
MDSALTLARSLYAALEAGLHGPALRHLFTDDALTLEHPNVLKPRGARSDLAALQAASQAGAALLERQQFALRSAIEHGELAIVRLVWTGVIAREVGPFRAGQVLRAQIAQFISARDGRISALETYDCYEPFTTSEDVDVGCAP